LDCRNHLLTIGFLLAADASKNGFNAPSSEGKCIISVVAFADYKHAHKVLLLKRML
jgi:hypothetical protein